MKTKQLFFATILLLQAVFCTSTLAQNIEKSVDGQTYIIEKVSTRITNKSNKIDYAKGPDCKDYAIKETTSTNAILKQVFTKEKIIALAQEKAGIGIAMYCDASGKVLEMWFSTNKEYFSFDIASSPKLITLQEVKKMEDLMKSYTWDLDIYGDCPGVKYYIVGKTLRFKDLLN